MQNTKKQYAKSFVDFDKVSTSKDKKKIIIHIGKMMVSLNLNYLKTIIQNAEQEAIQNQQPDEV